MKNATNRSAAAKKAASQRNERQPRRRSLSQGNPVSPGRKPLPSENIVRLATKPLRQGELMPPQGNEVKLLRGLVQPESATLQRRSLSRANWRTQFRHLGQYRFCSPIISPRASRRFARCLAKSAGRTASSRLSLEKGRLQMPAQSLL
jgi:hypothetical protein